MTDKTAEEREAYLTKFILQKRTFYTADQIRQLLINGAKDYTGDHSPLVRAYHPKLPIVYLASAAKLDNDLHYRYWGLIDLGIGKVEEGEFRLVDHSIKLFDETGFVMLPDDDFDANARPLSGFLAEARRAGRIVV